MEEYKKTIKNIIVKMITNDLTNGRKDNDLEQFSPNEINIYLNENKKIIQNVIDIIIDDYSTNTDLELLKNPLDIWIKEYLYDYITPFS